MSKGGSYDPSRYDPPKQGRPRTLPRPASGNVHIRAPETLPSAEEIEDRREEREEKREARQEKIEARREREKRPHVRYEDITPAEPVNAAEAAGLEPWCSIWNDEIWNGANGEPLGPEDFDD